MARPSLYDPDKLILVEGWARDGLTNEDIASNLGINVATLYEWQKKYPEFSEALKKGKDVADYMVENALFKTAIGYEFVEDAMTKEGPVTLTKYAQPNTTAQIFWLKNRKSDKWRDKPDSEEKLKKLISLLSKLNLSEEDVTELVNSL